MPLGIVTTLLRGRLVPGKGLTALTTKCGPIGFYKGKGCKSTGLHTRFCSQIWPNGGGIVHKLAKVDDSVTVDSGAVVHAHAMIGLHSHICSGSVVGSHVILGSHSEIGCNVSLHNCSLGSSCILHSGVCIGQDGFGFKINDMGEVVKKPQARAEWRLGDLQVDDHSWRDTIIGDHTKIDNLVQIGHNVIVGRNCMLCGQVGIAGSATIGDNVMMGGQSGVADHVSVTSNVRLAAKCGVTSDIVKPGDYAGFPAVRAGEWKRSVVSIRKL